MRFASDLNPCSVDLNRTMAGRTIIVVNVRATADGFVDGDVELVLDDGTTVRFEARATHDGAWLHVGETIPNPSSVPGVHAKT